MACSACHGIPQPLPFQAHARASMSWFSRLLILSLRQTAGQEKGGGFLDMIHATIRVFSGSQFNRVKGGA